MITKPLVFVSSTSRLEEERSELSAKLPSIYELYFYELDRSRKASPEEHCRKMIEKSDVFLGVLGPDYGSAFPGTAEKRSIVEWEFDTAHARGGLEIMTFIKKLGAGQMREPGQEAFVERVKQFGEGHWCQEYVTPAELVEKARASLEHWLADFWERVQAARLSLIKWLVPALVVLAVAVLLVLILFLAFGPAVTRNATIGICLCAAIVVALCGILALQQMGGQHG